MPEKIPYFSVKKNKDISEKEERSNEQIKSARVFIYSGGCSSNWLDSQQVIDYLEVNGHSIVHNPSEASVVILNTCSVDDVAEKGSFNKIETVKNVNPEAKLIVTGCLPSATKKELSGMICVHPQKLEDLDRIFDHPNISFGETQRPSNVEARPYWTSIEKYYAGDAKSFKEVWPDDEEIQYITGLNEKAWIIETNQGCLGHCNYCAIKRSRGNLKSISLERAVESLKVGLDRGYKEFKIWGDDVGDYGKDLGIDLSVLLAEYLKNESDFKLEILATNPNSFVELYDKLLPSLRDPRIDCLNITVQSGSDKILKAMNRSINVELLKQKIVDLRKEAPHLKLRSHYMVGYPGETEKDFQKTIDFINDTHIYQGLIFEFDPKPGTPAAKMNNQVPDEIKKQRHETLEKIFQKGSEKYYEGQVY